MDTSAQPKLLQYLCGVVWLGLLVLLTSSCGGGGGGGNTPTPLPPAPPPTPTAYAIQVSATPAEAVASVGMSATGSVTWQFSATPASSTATSYTVSSATSGLQITNASGSVAPGTTISTNLSYTCSADGTVTGEITLRVGSETETVSWSITCTTEQIEFTELEPSRTASQATASRTLVWMFQTSGPTDRSFSYSVSANNSNVTVGNATGSASAGDEIRNDLQFDCTMPESHSIQVSLNVGSDSQSVGWSVTCTEMNIGRVDAKFYQGTLIAEVEFNYNDERWEAQIVPFTYTADKTMSLASNRQLFVTLETEHEEASTLKVGLDFATVDANSTIDLVSRSQLPPRASGTRTTYLNRNVFDIQTSDLLSLGRMQILIDPDDELAQADEDANNIEFDLSTLDVKPLPEFKLVFVPIVGSHGSPDLEDVSGYVETVYELMPIGPSSVRTREPLDLSGYDFTFESDRTPLDALWDLWLAEADRDEYYHGIHVKLDDVRICGIAYIGFNVGVTAELNSICSANTVAHEIGHNLSLGHAPACGAEPGDPDYPRSDGSIGTEGGWLMRKRRPVGLEGLGVSKLYDTMAYCLETFTSRYSYGKAHDYWAGRFRPPVTSIASASAPEAVPPETIEAFDIIEDHSFVLSGSVSPWGEWSLRVSRMVEKEPLPTESRGASHRFEMVHSSTGSVLYQVGLPLYSAAHRPTDVKSWGLRMPAFKATGLEVRVIDQEENVVFSSELRFESFP